MHHDVNSAAIPGLSSGISAPMCQYMCCLTMVILLFLFDSDFVMFCDVFMSESQQTTACEAKNEKNEKNRKKGVTNQ